MTAAEIPLLPEDARTIHVWSMALDVNARELAVFRGMLAVEERARAQRFHFEKDRRHFTAARGALRTLLGRYLGTAGDGIVFAYGARGKPFVASPPANLKFNLSHSGGKALLAFARGREVGVDLEAGERLGGDWLALTRRVFSEGERGELMKLPEADRRAAFLDVWTRKEAFLKASGLGIADGLQQIEVTVHRAGPPELLSAAGERGTDWTLADLREFAGCAATLAAAGKAPARVERFRWEAEGVGEFEI